MQKTGPRSSHHAQLLVANRKARSEYSFEKEYSAGIVLTGPEVKSLRAGHASLSGSFVKLLQGEAYLVNSQVTPYQYSDNREYDSKRSRKLLLKKKELEQIKVSLEEKGRTVVPLAIVLERNHIKVQIAIGRGLKVFEKRERIKRRTVERDLAREFKKSLIK